MADKKNSFPPPPVAIRDHGDGLKRNSMEFTSRRHGGVGKSKSTDSTRKTVSTNAIHVRRRGKPPLPWQEKIFNASEHEVPSGPNPISNR
ncbi:hypothetical protein SLA2020_416930 [Shorea laevis]